MPIPFPKMDAQGNAVERMPRCSNCGEGTLTISAIRHRGDSMECPECKEAYLNIGGVAYRSDEIDNACDDHPHGEVDDPTRHSVFGSLRQMADMFPDDNIVVLGDDLMTQLDAERLEGRITGHARGFRIGFVLGTIVTGIICGAFLLQAIKDMRGL